MLLILLILLLLEMWSWPVLSAMRFAEETPPALAGTDSASLLSASDTERDREREPDLDLMSP